MRKKSDLDVIRAWVAEMMEEGYSLTEALKILIGAE